MPLPVFWRGVVQRMPIESDGLLRYRIKSEKIERAATEDLRILSERARLVSTAGELAEMVD
jgi:hypothetical protein